MTSGFNKNLTGPYQDQKSVSIQAKLTNSKKASMKDAQQNTSEIEQKSQVGKNKEQKDANIYTSNISNNEPSGANQNDINERAILSRKSVDKSQLGRISNMNKTQNQSRNNLACQFSTSRKDHTHQGSFKTAHQISHENQIKKSGMITSPKNPSISNVSRSIILRNRTPQNRNIEIPSK